MTVPFYHSKHYVLNLELRTLSNKINMIVKESLQFRQRHNSGSVDTLMTDNALKLKNATQLTIMQ
jgi:hypothetical protein